MNAVTLFVDVPNLAAGTGPDGFARRVVGLLDDRETVAIAIMKAGDALAEPEFTFKLADAVALAERALAGDRRALTTPGLARILSASAALLFRVSQAAGAIQATGHHDGTGSGHLDDQQEARGDEGVGG